MDVTGATDSRTDYLKRQVPAAEYLLYRYSGRPVFAVPANPRSLRRAALRRFQPSTTKRALYRTIVGWSMLVGADWLFSQSVQSPLAAMPGSTFDWENWLQEMHEYFGIAPLTAATFWPTTTDRSRLYVHLLDGNDPVGFAKISLSFKSSSNARLSREADTLRKIGTKSLQTFCAPRLLMEGTIGRHLFLLLEPLPTSARPIARKKSAYPEKCVEEYSGPVRRIAANTVPTLSWWDQYIRRLGAQCQLFHDEMIESLKDPEIAVCRAHGDLSSHNVVRDGRTLWIYDWEESVPDAPAQTDALGFVMAMNQSAIRKNPVLWAGRFKKRFLENVQVDTRAEFMMALAFRHAAGIDDATLIIQNWGRS